MLILYFNTQIYYIILYFEQLGGPYNGLDKVCFAPLVSKFKGPPKVSDCVVQSVWGYFGNKPYKLNKPPNPDGYLDKLRLCFQ